MVVAPDLPTFSRAPTTTLEGWRSFVDSEPADIAPLPTRDLETLTPARRELYDELRISYHSELVIVQTSTVRSIVHQGRLLTMLNQREVGARRGLVVSGLWAPLLEDVGAGEFVTSDRTTYATIDATPKTRIVTLNQDCRRIATDFPLLFRSRLSRSIPGLLIHPTTGILRPAESEHHIQCW